MKLSSKQIKWINKERQSLIEEIKIKEATKNPNGIMWYYDRLRAIQVVIDLHNLEVEKQNEQRDPVPHEDENSGYSFVLSFGC